MFALTPWRKERNEGTVVPRFETPFRLMRDEFESLFNRMMGGWPTYFNEEEWPMTWGMETEEKEKETVVRFELPGFEPSEVAVNAHGDTVMVEAEHKEPEVKEEKKGNGKRFARRYAHVKRTFTLPGGTDTSKIEAAYRHGILELRLPRSPEAEARRIEVKT